MSEHQQIQQSKKSDSTSQKQATPVNLNTVSHPASIVQRAKINPRSLTPADVMQLQSTIGNRAVVRLLSEIGLIPSKAKQAPPVQRQELVQRQEIPEEEEPLQGKIIGTVQRQEIPEEEEPLQGKFENKPEKATFSSCFADPIMQMQEIPEEEEPLQGKFETIQRLEPEEEEKLQMKSVVQRQEIPEEEEPLQGKMIGTIQRQEISEEEEPLQKKSENNTGMPDNLKAGVENLSGIDMSDVRVHYNSSKPAHVGALAYTQGTNIHVAPGQERHLPHEAWHVVQQAQRRVRPTVQLKDVAVNDEKGLEHEADEMGDKAVTNSPQSKGALKEQEMLRGLFAPVQRYVNCFADPHETDVLYTYTKLHQVQRLIRVINARFPRLLGQIAERTHIPMEHLPFFLEHIVTVEKNFNLSEDEDQDEFLRALIDELNSLRAIQEPTVRMQDYRDVALLQNEEMREQKGGTQTRVEGSRLAHGKFSYEFMLDYGRSISTTYNIDDWTKRRGDTCRLVSQGGAPYASYVREILNYWNGQGSLVSYLVQNALLTLEDSGRTPANCRVDQGKITMKLDSQRCPCDPAWQAFVMHMLQVSVTTEVGREGAEASLNTNDFNFNSKAYTMDWQSVTNRLRNTVRRMLLNNICPPAEAQDPFMDTIIFSDLIESYSLFRELNEKGIIYAQSGNWIIKPKTQQGIHKFDQVVQLDNVIRHIRFLLWIEWTTIHNILHSPV